MKTLEEKIKEYKSKNIYIRNIVSLSIADTRFNSNIIELLKIYGTSFEYPEKTTERVNLEILKNIDDEFQMIDWKGFNWLVIAYKFKTRHNLEIHIQLYKEIKNLLIEEGLDERNNK
jgi:hypothetical protein